MIQPGQRYQSRVDPKGVSVVTKVETRITITLHREDRNTFYPGSETLDEVAFGLLYEPATDGQAEVGVRTWELPDGNGRLEQAVRAYREALADVRSLWPRPATVGAGGSGGLKMELVEPGSPMSVYELAPGVKGYAMAGPDGSIYVPWLEATTEGNGDVGRFLDSLDSGTKIPTVISTRLVGMLARRGWKWIIEQSEMGPTDVWVKP